MGYAFAFSACWCCEVPFSYNPMRVPSLRINGVREPLCAGCVSIANVTRAKKGLPPIVPHPDAYEPCDENELSD